MRWLSIGSVLSLPLVTWLIGSFGWRASFVATGVLRLGWAVSWAMSWAVSWAAIHRNQEQQPLGDARAVAAPSGLARNANAGSKIPWAPHFHYRPILGMMIWSFCHNFASNLAGIVTTTFTGVMLTAISDSFIVPPVVAGGFCLLGVATYLLLVGELAPLPQPLEDLATHRASAAE